MATIDVLLPFALPPPELARDLLRQASLPALSILLARGAIDRQEYDPYSRLLPHQQWLLRLGNPGLARYGVAASAMAGLGLTPGAGKWFMLHPASLHIARDHLVLTDLRHLQLEQQESRALFDVVRPLFEEAGRELVYGTETVWFMRADDWAAIETSAPDAAVGHNIDIWMPRGSGERAWRKLHNEVQMMWHTVPSNHQREASGQRMINALWFWDTDTNASTAIEPVAGKYDQSAAMLDAFVPGTPRASQPSLPALIAAGGRSLAVVDSMTPAALSGDWHQWIDAMQAAEQAWFAPLLEALRSGKIDRATLVLSDSTRLLQLQCKRWDLKKFWSRPSLAALA